MVKKNILEEAFMKKCFLLFFILLLVAAPVFGQDDDSKKVDEKRGNDSTLSTLTGGKVGLTGSLARKFPIESEYGYNQWLGAIIHVSSSLAVKPSILFISKTDKYEDNLSTQESTDDISNIGAKLDILYYFSPQNKFSLFAGPSFQYLIYSDMDRDTSGAWDDKKTTTMMIQLILGAQYTFGTRFALFMDLSFGMTTSTYTSKNYDSGGTLIDDDENTSTTMQSIYGRFGVIFYL